MSKGEVILAVTFVKNNKLLGLQFFAETERVLMLLLHYPVSVKSKREK